MKGIVFNLLEEVVTERHGAVCWDEVVDAVDARGAYTSLGNYEDADLLALFGALAEHEDVPVDAVVRSFGRDAAPRFAVRYRGLFAPFEDTREILRGLNDIIHPEVRKLYPGASVPTFGWDETDDVFTLIYTSPKRLCRFAEGLIEGTAGVFDQEVDIQQPECMFRGDPHCRIVCTFTTSAGTAGPGASAASAGPSAAETHAAGDPVRQAHDDFASGAEGVEEGIRRLMRRLDRERIARLEAEGLAERATRSLYETNRDLARSNQDLEQFAYAASHDLKEPLRMISSFVELLGRRREHDAEASEWMAYVQDGVVRMRRLIDDLLLYSQAGNLSDRFEEVDLERVAREVVEELGPEIKASGAGITVRSLPTVPAAKPLMRQLLVNLMGNALKFRREGVPPEIALSAVKEGVFWRIEVRDNGIGFDPKHKGRIFEMFRRLHGHDTYPGTGLGLALCKRIVELHGGTIDAASESDQGARFWFTLPDRHHQPVSLEGLSEGPRDHVTGPSMPQHG